eukprot:CAMPEP_0204833990 /NCGR_PEP_ID=MMETSP1346-20131115/18461_1 /ASSEMBLY_ACC=CAM_ASM_000771 /TAXON_ID=215587 /ORGANISM="Aplanochytrium stocchinoi, Strain GSBS06" /LENGTH=227 /DNA_ID=CAMNT_0051966959 /DNA_START=426 /DNA_END=1109 /DNA_ORIENTATION=+
MARKNKKKQAAAVPKPTAAKPTTNKTVQTAQHLKNVANRLNQRRTFLETKAASSKKQAIQLKKQGNKRQAILHLRRMKQFEKEALRMDDLIMQVENQQLAIESAGVMSDAVGAIQAGLSTQRNLANKLNPDKIADDLDEVQELMQDAEEVNMILGESAGLDAYDEDELMAELEEPDDYEVGVDASTFELPTAPVHTDLPKVPVGAIKNNPITAEDDEALRQLEAELL